MEFDLRKTFEFLKQDFPDKFAKLGSFDTFQEEDLRKFLEKNFSKDQLVEVNAKIIGLPFISLEAENIPKEVYEIFPYKMIKKYAFVPFEKNENIISVATYNPQDYTANQALKFFLREKGLTYKLYVATEETIQRVISNFENLSNEVKETLQQFNEKLELINSSDKDSDQTASSTENIEAAPIIKIVSVILKNAVEGGASDIHIEGSEKTVRVRFRVDGVLHTSLILPKDVYTAVIARIKILSNLKIDESRKPQDGRFSIIENERKIDFRVSTFPTQYGEKVVLRILDSSKGIRSLDQLGFLGPKAQFIQEALTKPYGMILITGPTGSGKSTTLYTLLSTVNNEEINIVTLEDPIEYYLAGINQSQVKPEINYTFASGLRSILRQDPDVIMVGEIRDGETASLAVQSALTGHLVFSTLHTNDAPGALPRLMDMGLEPFLLSASLQLVIAQRLVRKLCDQCKKKVALEGEMRQYILDSLSHLTPEYMAQYYSGDFSSLYTPVGCAQCKNGFKGRMSIFEVVVMTEELQSIVEKNFDEAKVMDYLKGNNYVTMKQDGILKVLQGHLSLEELLTTVEV